MAGTISSIAVFISVIALVQCLPNPPKEVKENSVEPCPAGQVSGPNGKCVESAVTVQTPVIKKATNGTALTKKQIQRRRKLQRKLNKEFRDLKKLLLDDKKPVTCAVGQQLSELGICVDATTEVNPPKTEKQLKFQRKVERELERALKKELQNELRRRKRKQKKDKGRKNGPKKEGKEEATTGEGAAVPKSVPLNVPVCDGGSPAEDCRPDKS